MSHPLANVRPIRPNVRERNSRVNITTVDRESFVRKFGEDYRNGQHVTMLGPTQRGKTYMCVQLLGSGAANPQRKCIILAGKPPKRDATMAGSAKKLNLRIVEEWPPLYTPRDRKRNGYVLRPRQTLDDLDADEANLKRQFGKALKSAYASGKPVIMVVDEAHMVQNDLKLKKEYEASLMRGAPVVAQWSLIQRGRYMSYHAYAAPEHIFIFYDPDLSNRQRYSEIGGVDPRQMADIVSKLKTETEPKSGMTISQCLYYRRSDPDNLIIVDM